MKALTNLELRIAPESTHTYDCMAYLVLDWCDVQCTLSGSITIRDGKIVLLHLVAFTLAKQIML